MRIDDVPNPDIDKLKSAAESYLLNRRDMLKSVRSAGKEIVAFSTSHGKMIMVGVGVTATLVAGGVIIYPRWKARRQRLENK